MKIKNKINILFVTVIATCTALSFTGCAKSVGKQITRDKFNDFYYTYSTTVNPPEFQRYRFYMEDGKAFFYHEKREGNNTFLTEEDITVSGTKELSSEEWETFWNYIDGGSVVKRKENTNSGGSGPWLYLYWDGDKNIRQEFSFRDDALVYDFEEFCEELANVQQKEADIASAETLDEASETIDELATEQITKENVVNLNASIVTVDRFVSDELNRMVVGDMITNYVEIDEESGKLCPNLLNSLNEFNENRKKAYEEYYPMFCETANKQFEKAFEETHSDNTDEPSEPLDSSVDSMQIDVMRADNVAMSLLTTSLSYWVNSDVIKLYIGTTYDSQTGNKLELTDVVTDIDAYKKAVESELNRKYQNVKLDDVDLEDYLGWVLTPEGMIVYFPEDYTTTTDGRDVSVQINIDEYPGLINEKYCIAPDEYAIPFDGDEVFYMDVNGDLEREAVTYSPLGPGDFVGEEYPSYEIYVNGKSYQNFDEDWFYGYKPYYVRKNNKSYIYCYTEGYGHDFITVNRFELNEPICVAKLPATPFYVDEIEDPSEEYIYRHIAFSNPSIVHDALSFDRNVCGTYRGDEGDGWELRFWDICNIDGRYYLDYIGEYDYTAAEIELLDENPYLCGDELRYMVKIYPYSGFSFGGEYQGEGQVMYISSKVGIPGKRIELSPGNPFFYALQSMYDIEGVSMHEIQDKCETNKVAPKIVGSWRSIVKSDLKEYDVYLQFNEDGRVDIVRKNECYTPMVYRGIYSLDEKDGKFIGKIEAEAMGMGRQPVADWILEFDPASDNPIKIASEYDENPFVYDAEDMIFTKTESGKHDKYIHPGPYKRADEVTEMWDEYIYSDDEDSFYYDFQPEYVEAIIKGAVKAADGTSYKSYGIQDNKKGGEMWIQVFKDVLPSIQVTKNWIRYDFKDAEYYDIHDNCLENE